MIAWSNTYLLNTAKGGQNWQDRKLLHVEVTTRLPCCSDTFWVLPTLHAKGNIYSNILALTHIALPTTKRRLNVYQWRRMYKDFIAKKCVNLVLYILLSYISYFFTVHRRAVVYLKSNGVLLAMLYHRIHELVHLEWVGDVL